MNDKVNKLTPYSDGKKRKMKMLKLTAVALTARGANPEANVTFFKSDKTSAVKNGDLVDMVTSAEDGHQHGISVEVYDGSLYINVGYAKSSDSDNGHYHVLTSDGAGGFKMASNAGHSHTISSQEIQDNLFNMLNKGIGEDTITKERAEQLTAVNKDGSLAHTEDTMPEKLEADLATAKAEIATLKSQLATAVALGGLSDSHKSHYNSLSAADQVLFLGKSSADRNIELEAIKAADPVEYTAEDGTEYRKSAGASIINMAKRLDTQDKELAKQTALNENANLVKRAADELGNVAGEDVAKVALLKSIESIEDEETRTAVGAMIKACNSGLAKAFTEIGHQAPVVNKKAEDGLMI